MKKLKPSRQWNILKGSSLATLKSSSALPSSADPILKFGSCQGKALHHAHQGQDQEEHDVCVHVRFSLPAYPVRSCASLSSMWSACSIRKFVSLVCSVDLFCSGKKKINHIFEEKQKQKQVQTEIVK